jgi:hypothetical protein
VEAFEIYESDPENKAIVSARLKEYIADATLETRRAFDEFIVESRRVNSVTHSCEAFVTQLQRAKVEHAIDEERVEIMRALSEVRLFIGKLLQRLEGSDPPPLQGDSSLEAEEH